MNQKLRRHAPEGIQILRGMWTDELGRSAGRSGNLGGFKGGNQSGSGWDAGGGSSWGKGGDFGESLSFDFGGAKESGFGSNTGGNSRGGFSFNFGRVEESGSGSNTGGNSGGGFSFNLGRAEEGGSGSNPGGNSRGSFSFNFGRAKESGLGSTAGGNSDGGFSFNLGRAEEGGSGSDAGGLSVMGGPTLESNWRRGSRGGFSSSARRTPRAKLGAEDDLELPCSFDFRDSKPTAFESKRSSGSRGGLSFDFGGGKLSNSTWGSGSGGGLNFSFGSSNFAFGGSSSDLVPFKGPQDPCPSVRDPTQLSTLAQQHSDAGARASLKLGLLTQIGHGVPQDEEAAAKLIKTSAELGLADGMREYGRCLAYGIGVEQNLENAQDWYEKAIENNDIMALYDCAVLLRDTHRDEKRVIEYLKKASERGMGESAFLLADMYHQDMDNDNSYRFARLAEQCEFDSSYVKYQFALLSEDHRPESAAAVMKEAAEANCPLACNRFGVYLETGRGVAQNLQEACTWFKKASDLGCPEGMFNYARCLEQGIGTGEDKAKAYELYELAANKGVMQAYCNMGYMLMEGDGIEKDEAKGAECFKKAADAGDEIAEENYKACQKLGIVAKTESEIEELEQEALGGDPKAQWLFGAKLEYGDGVERDISRAADFYCESAEQGYPDGCNSYGLCLLTGAGVEKDESLGVTFLCQAAENGSPEGMYNYALCLETGRGIEKDPVRAAVFYKKAADLGHGKAQSNYGTCLENGIGVERDIAEAARYYRMAAESGDAAGLCNYGVCLETGNGVGQDIEKAIAMYKESAEKGDKGGRENYERLTGERLPDKE